MSVPVKSGAGLPTTTANATVANVNAVNNAIAVFIITLTRDVNFDTWFQKMFNAPLGRARRGQFFHSPKAVATATVAAKRLEQHRDFSDKPGPAARPRRRIWIFHR